MIVGFGTKDQEATLKTAGAERVFFHPEQTPDLFKYAGSAVRAGDTFLVVQPTLLRVVDYRDLHEACAKGLTFQVVGNDPLPISQNMNFTEFRRTRAKGVQNTYAAAPTGRPAAIVYSLEQADAILREWHAKPRKKPADIVSIANNILRLPEGKTVNVQWLKDLCKKFTGNTRRDPPEGWTGIQIDADGREV